MSKEEQQTYEKEMNNLSPLFRPKTWRNIKTNQRIMVFLGIHANEEEGT